ncbi:Lar family restriction alleviation protein [Adlercreutzia mucosicola]|uniref:Lar family restriction alleviation protein n=1 Tax=Adlercreutzia mucosicola TaxID=580026 RepID=UPI0004832917|nr:Lar family restriction alleviation protein [Adlercreutzia mucosicola]MCR2034135.1 Lar family restriction alleviation protein [Adlercreutzia mucosicola]
MSDELKPCPFCGGDATEGPVFVTRMPSGDIGWVGCVPCGVFVNYTHGEGGRREAVRAWNTRAERTCRPKGGVGGWFCSECGVFVNNDCIADAQRWIAPRYCPNCDAKVVR